ncbi:linoleate diol synthase [Ramaria rubella]|nr:linoleate diol synthase [Ramaria rubella]
MTFLNALPDVTSLINSASTITNKSLDAIAQTSDAINVALGPIRYGDPDKNYNEPQSRLSKLIEEIKCQIKRGAPVTLDFRTISAAIDAIKHGQVIDDRKMLLEQLITLMARIPDNTFSEKLQNEVISLLYNDLPHPQISYVGAQYAWRSADGSGNNLNIPDLGKAHSPYARSVQQQHPLPRYQLPDASLLFDTLLKRDKYVPHPAGVSSMLFSFAILIIHSIFHTCHSDSSINETSSYLDLSPLYGTNQKEQDLVRKKDGRGKLHNDVFSENRVLLLPPSAAALLVVFNRNHQYIATQLLEVNERGTFTDPDILDEQKARAQDDEIFNTARLINCGHFVSIIRGDYLSTILGTVRDGLSFSLNPFDELRKEDQTFVDRGRGNVCSVEFNLLYHWHATISQSDEKWTESVFREIFQSKSWDKITIQDFIQAVRLLEQTHSADVTTWTFGNLQRKPNGMFKDEDLARILQDATQHSAAAFKARGIPDVLRVVELMSIEQARSWGVCTMNEFRTFLGLKPYSSFQEWNPDPEVAETAMRLYGHIDNLELYIGLQAEEAKPVVPGAGLCPGYTISRAILSDAVALTRGDRYFTTDFTPHNLTAWGFKDCARDPTNPGFGTHLGRLLLRNLEGSYPFNSTFTWFPFATPDSMKHNLSKLNLAGEYDFSRPTVSPPVQAIVGYEEVAAVFRDSFGFRTPYVDSAGSLIQGRGYLLSLDEPSKHSQDLRVLCDALFDTPHSLNKYAAFYHSKTKELIDERSFLLVGNRSRNIDIVRDVLNVVPVLWVSTQIAGLPLKTKENPCGTILEQQLSQMLREIFSFIFLEVDAAKEMRMEAQARIHTKTILSYIMAHLNGVAGRGFPLKGIVDSLSRLVWPQKTSSCEFYEKLYATGRPLEELANDVYSIVVIASVEFAQALVHVINFYLDDDRSVERETISFLTQSADRQADLQLEGYVREALRLDTPLSGVYREAKLDQQIGLLQVKKDERLFLSVADANLDPLKFPNPLQVDPTRPRESYLGLADGANECFGDAFVSKVTMTQVVRAIFSLKNIRRAAGQSGLLKRSSHMRHGTRHWQYLDSNQELSPWASSMVIQACIAGLNMSKTAKHSFPC